MINIDKEKNIVIIFLAIMSSPSFNLMKSDISSLFQTADIQKKLNPTLFQVFLLSFTQSLRSVAVFTEWYIHS